MFVLFPNPVTRRYLRGMGVRTFCAFADANEIAREFAHAREQHPEESTAELNARAFARAVCHHLNATKRGPLTPPPAWLLWVGLLLAFFLLGRYGHAQSNVNIQRVGATDVPAGLVGVNGFRVDLNSVVIHTICDSGCAAGAATQDVNVKNYNGAAVSATNAAWVQPGTGAVFTVTWPSALHIIVDSGAVSVTQTTSPWVVSCSTANCAINVANWAGSALGAMANYGTPPGAVLVPGVNAYVTNIPHVVVDTAPSTAVTNAGLTNLDVALSTRTKPADQQHAIIDSGAVTSITNALPAGSNLLGKVGIDQTTPGTTNGVQVNAALPAGTNVIGHVVADSGSTTTVTQSNGANLHVAVDSTVFPILTQQQLSNPLLYNAALKNYCKANLCPGVK